MRAHGALRIRRRESLADVLTDYLAVAGRKPWQWGELDCFLFVADFMQEAFGVDPAGEFRGAYTTSREARNIMRQHGGVLSFCDERLQSVGWRRATQTRTRTGDVGLARVPFKRRRDRMIFVPVGAIAIDEDRWAIKTVDRGLVIHSFIILRAWTADHG